MVRLARMTETPCPYCHATIPATATRCRHCGGAFAYCRRCGGLVSTRERTKRFTLLFRKTVTVCGRCGKRVDRDRAEASARQRPATRAGRCTHVPGIIAPGGEALTLTRRRVAGSSLTPHVEVVGPAAISDQL